MSTNNYPTRLNYYDGLFLQASDFITEQVYGMQALSLHNQYIHKAYGIAEGLTLSITPNNIVNKTGNAGQYVVEVAPGFAQCQISTDRLENYCVGLYLPEKQTVTASNTDISYIVICYQEKEDYTDVDKGPDPIHLVEEPLIECRSSYNNNDKTCVLLGKITPGATPELNYADNHYIYDINQIFDIAYDTSNLQYNLSLNGGLTTKALNVGNTSSITTSDAVKIQGGLYTSTVTTEGDLTAKSSVNISGNLDVQGGLTVAGVISTVQSLSAVTATITGSGIALAADNGTITAKDIIVSETLDLKKDFSVQNQFTAEKGIAINTGDLKITAGDVILNKGDIQATGNLTLNKGDINCQSIIASKDFSASNASPTFKSLSVSDALQADSAAIKSKLDIQGAFTAKQGVTVEGNAQFNDELNANNITTSGYLTVGQNMTVQNSLTAQSLKVTQGLTVEENIVAQGNLTIKGALHARAIHTDDDLDFTVPKLTSKSALHSHGGNIVRDFYTDQHWQATPSIDIPVPLIQEKQAESNLMYRIVVEGCSNFGPINSELSAMLLQDQGKGEQASTLINPQTQDLGKSATVTQAVKDGIVTVTLSPSDAESDFQWLGVSASVWIFVES